MARTTLLVVILLQVHLLLLHLTPVGTSNVNVPTVTNTSTGCDSSYSSSPWSEDMTVDPPTVPGTLTPNYTICDGDVGPYTFNLTGYTGTVQNWDSSDNDGFTWYDIGNTTDSHTVVSPHLNYTLPRSSEEWCLSCRYFE